MLADLEAGPWEGDAAWRVCVLVVQCDHTVIQHLEEVDLSQGGRACGGASQEAVAIQRGRTAVNVQEWA